MDIHEQPIDVEAVFEEIQRYLAAVEVYRAEGYGPRWRSDTRPRRRPTRARPTPAPHVSPTRKDD
jgi:hypothetical protein